MITIAAILICLTAAANAAAGARAHSPRYTVAAQLNAQLTGTPLAGHWFALEAAGWRYHIHPAFMAAVAGIESAWGRLACNGNRWNIWGLGSCGTTWSPPWFPTARAAFDYYARFLRTRWPQARTPYDFHGYCVVKPGVDCPTWGDKVSWNMERLGFQPTVRYGR